MIGLHAGLLAAATDLHAGLLAAATDLHAGLLVAATDLHAGLLVATMAVVTMLTRFLPFLVLRGETPPYVAYLGRVLPAAIMGMLVVYCLREVQWTAAPYGLPELVAVACVVALQAWRRNSLVSILTGTVVYMLLVRM